MSKKEILRLGRRGRLVRVVPSTNHGADVWKVLYKVEGKRKQTIYPKAERALAIAFAEGLANEQTKLERPAEPLRHTIEQIYAKYRDDVFRGLRPRSQVLYDQYFGHFSAFAGPHVVAQDVGIETMSKLRIALEEQGKAVNTIRRIMAITRMVYRWAEMHELIAKNRVGRYVYRVAKEDRPVSPDEYREEDLLAILAQFDPKLSSQWRPWVALTLCGRQGARQNSVLHLAWDDIDFDRRRFIWRAEWDKTGVERRQPIRRASLAALQVAIQWRDGSKWVIPGYSRSAEDTPYTIQSLWAALKRAEERAGIEHKPRRGAHGLRRLLAGDVNAMTGNAKLAMEAIGDRDIRQADRYLKDRMDALEKAFEDLDDEADAPESASELRADDAAGQSKKKLPSVTPSRKGA